MKRYLKSKPIILIIAALGAVLLLFIIIQLSALTLKYSRQTERLFNEIEDINKKYNLLENNVTAVNDGSNEVRRILSLTPNNLSGYDYPEDMKDQETRNDDIVFYNALDYLLIHYDLREIGKDLKTIVIGSEFKEYLYANNLTSKKTGALSYKISNSKFPYFLIRSDNPDEPVFTIESIKGNIKAFPLTGLSDNLNPVFLFMDEEKLLLESHYTNLQKMQKRFKQISGDKELEKYLNLENLQISGLKTKNGSDEFSIYNKDRSFEITLIFDTYNVLYRIGEAHYTTFEGFYSDLFRILRDSDKRTVEIKVVDEARSSLEDILEDEAFIAYLHNNNFSVVNSPREDNDYFYYDLKDKNNLLQGSFAVQKIIGDIYLMDSMKYFESTENTEEIPLMEIPENLPVIVDKYSDNNSTTFILIGSHENNADTIILVHGDVLTGKTTLISVPRDLYYQERKINDYYRTYGGSKFIEILSDITGLTIKGYIAVDMYAFVDLINILGGIDVTLEADLIDPTYKVRDDGEWSTLFYKKGEQHLDGIESLRIARSRHTSSDFGRTSRQQLIIQGIKDKLAGFDITDLGTILQLFQTMDKYLDSNFSAVEMLSLFMKYRDTEIDKKQGLSVFNVLYNTYTNISKLEDESKQFEEGFVRGYWILLPRKDDWNVIKWYIRSLIEENQT